MLYVAKMPPHLSLLPRRVTLYELSHCPCPRPSLRQTAGRRPGCVCPGPSQSREFTLHRDSAGRVTSLPFYPHAEAARG